MPRVAGPHHVCPPLGLARGKCEPQHGPTVACQTRSLDAATTFNQPQNKPIEARATRTSESMIVCPCSKLFMRMPSFVAWSTWKVDHV